LKRLFSKGFLLLTVLLAVPVSFVPLNINDGGNGRSIEQSEAVKVIQPIAQPPKTKIEPANTFQYPGSMASVIGSMMRPGAKVAVLDVSDIPSSSAMAVTGVITTEFGNYAVRDKVEIYSQSLNRRYRTISDQNGYFLFADVIPSTDYLLTVTPRGMYKKYRKTVPINFPDQSQLSIVLQSLPVSILEGVVVNSDAVPVSGFEMRLFSKEKSRWQGVIVTDSAGQFQLFDVPTGGIIFSSKYGHELSITGYSHDVDQDNPVTLLVDSGNHEINGMVFDQYNEPVAGANVLLNWKKIEGEKRIVVSRRTITDPNGAFSIKGLGRGLHDLVFAESTGAAHRQTVDVGSENTDLTIVLQQNRLSQ